MAANVARHGTGALNIDGCRIPTSADDPNRRDNPAVDRQAWREAGPSTGYGYRQTERRPTLQNARWPANVVHDGSDEVLAAFAQYGERNGGHHPASRGRGGLGTSGHAGQLALIEQHSDTGTAARFFYSAKVSPAERGDSTHPTMKPVALMRWLARLVTPPGGTVLDPFAGSGTTGVACAAEGFRFVGIEREAEYHAIAARRVAHAYAQPSLFDEAA